ncbi:hypothetical protein GGD81_003240 [Rhodobium orientis]|uniref:Sulfotransferase family protein n=1 Tax=Rhodobium orientis TaxID=34017 RepID=A0A327JY81_9HYPH|nr:hypothetical protein [Rhodobium orientis]MBK5950655.1 hypothetical protein [Rhodobium orientis]RAI28038.1 hypothetical protein CH339_08005 [Rhodobium orientis]
MATPEITFGQNGHAEYAKIFVVGLPKTGLTSLRRIFEIAGLRQRGKNKALLRAIWNGDCSNAGSFFEEADAFSDWPIPIVYRELWQKYKNKALFILSMREDECAWIESLKTHAESYHWQGNVAMRRFFGYYYPHGREEEHIAAYRDFNTEVLNFFRDVGGSVMVYRTGNKDDLNRLASVLGVAPSAIAGVHENSGSQRRRRYPIRSLMNRFLVKIYRAKIALFG